MTDQNVDNSNQDGAGGTPSQPVSHGASGSINGADGLAQLLDAKLNEALKPILAEVRGVQGRQDKDRKGFQEFMDEYRKHKSKGLSDSDAEIAAESSIKERTAAQADKDLLRKIAEKVLGPSFAGNEPSQHANIVNDYGLDANDPEVIANVLSQTDPKDAEINAARMSKKRSQVTPPSATAASTLTSAPPQPADLESKIRKYQTDMIAARGKPSDIRAIKEAAAKAGIPVESVVFQ